MISSHLFPGLREKINNVIMIIRKKLKKIKTILLLALRACNASITWRKSCNSGNMILRGLDGTEPVRHKILQITLFSGGGTPRCPFSFFPARPFSFFFSNKPGGAAPPLGEEGRPNVSSKKR